MYGYMRIVAAILILWWGACSIQIEAKLRTLSYSFHKVTPSHVLTDTGYDEPPITVMNARISPVVLIQKYLQQNDPNAAPAIIGDVFNYPNPFRLSEGTEIG